MIPFSREEAVGLREVRTGTHVNSTASVYVMIAKYKTLGVQGYFITTAAFKAGNTLR